MQEQYPIEAGVSLECRLCNRRTNIPALKVLPGVKCSHCGAMLVIDTYAKATKAVMLMAASGRSNVRVI